MTFPLLALALVSLALGFAAGNIDDLSFQMQHVCGSDFKFQLHGKVHPPPSHPKKPQLNKQARQ